MGHVPFFKRIYYFLFRARTSLLVGILIGASLLFLLLAILFNNINDVVQLLFLVLAFFTAGLAGLPIIINREVNFTVISFEGLAAVLIGLFLSLSGFFVSGGFLIALIKMLVHK